MLVVVNQPHTDNFRIEGDISSSSLDMLKRYYGKSLHVENNSNDDEWVNIDDSEWYKQMKEKYSPSSNLAFYRKEKKLTQTVLGERLGVPKQYVSDMEHDRRTISKEMAKRIAVALDCPVSLFI